jgi:Arc/MetJ-type ribon-helix-helix transcriptional regulator
MKVKLSVSMDESTLQEVEQALEEGNFRNKSHFIEYATAQLLKQRKP